MKILHIIETLGRGGCEKALDNWLPELKAKGHDVEVAVLMPPYHLADSLAEKGITVHRLGLNHRWNLLQGIGRLTELLRGSGYDVAHAHLFFSTVYLALTKPLIQAPLRVVQYHNLGYDSFPADTLWRKFRKELDAALTVYAMDGLTANSKASAMHYRRHLRLLDEVQAIPVCPDANNIQALMDGKVTPADLGSLGIVTGESTLILPGRLVHEKGHCYLLRALTILRDKGIKPRLLILGAGPLQKEIQLDIEELELQDQVSIHAPLANKEMLRVVKACNVVVVPSIFEGLSIVVMEALALGIPLLASKVGGIPEVIEEGVDGILVPPKDPNALASAIERILSDKRLRDRLSEAGPAKISSKYASDIIASRWEVYYSGLSHRQPPVSLLRVLGRRLCYLTMELPRRIYRRLLCRIFGLSYWHVASGINKPYVRDIIGLLNSRSRGTIVEYGCGLGDIISRVRADKRYGYDSEPGVIRAAKIYNALGSSSLTFDTRDFIEQDIPEVEADAWIMVNWPHMFPESKLVPRLYDLFNRLPAAGMIVIDTVDREEAVRHDIRRIFADKECDIREISPDYGDSRTVYSVTRS